MVHIHLYLCSARLISFEMNLKTRETNALIILNFNKRNSFTGKLTGRLFKFYSYICLKHSALYVFHIAALYVFYI